jgi:hypothetical protein
MIYIQERGATRSGRNYVREYIERIPDTRHDETITNLFRSNAFDINSLMSRLTILQEEEKTLREYGAPSIRVIKAPIAMPAIGASEFSIVFKLSAKRKQQPFSGEEGEDPSLHLDMFYLLCNTFKPKEIPIDDKLLRLFRWSLKGKAYAWLRSLPHRYIRSWEQCCSAFLLGFTSMAKKMQARKDLTDFTQ